MGMTMITTMTMIVVVASLLDVVDVGVALDARLMTPGSKTHLRKTITSKTHRRKIITASTDVADGVKPVVQATMIPTVAVDGVVGVVLATTTLAITMTMTTTMTMTLTTTMILTTTLTTTMTTDVVDGVVEDAMEDHHVASALMGPDHLVQTTRGQARVLTAPNQPGSRLARAEEDHDAPTIKGLSVLMVPNLITAGAKTQANPHALMELPLYAPMVTSHPQGQSAQATFLCSF